jgi:hypothetical protein
MALPEAGQHPRHHLVGAEVRGVHDEVGVRVVRLALPVQGLDVLEAPPGQHGPLALATGPLAELAQVAAEPDDGAQLPEDLHPSRPAR